MAFCLNIFIFAVGSVLAVQHVEVQMQASFGFWGEDLVVDGHAQVAHRLVLDVLLQVVLFLCLLCVMGKFSVVSAQFLILSIELGSIWCFGQRSAALFALTLILLTEGLRYIFIRDLPLEVSELLNRLDAVVQKGRRLILKSLWSLIDDARLLSVERFGI